MSKTPDKGIKNVVIKRDALGKVTSKNSVVLRFRIVSEDKNRKSALKTGTTSVRVVVQASSINPVLNNDLKIYDSGIVNLV